MRFAYVRNFSSAYDILAIRYFQQNGLDVDPTLSYQKARAIKSALRLKQKRTAIETKFCSYVTLWETRPDHRPTQRLVIDRIFADGDTVGVDELARLQTMLKKGEGDLLLSEEKVAEEIWLFYTEALLPSIRNDIANGDVRALHNYVEPHDYNRLPDLRMAPSPGFEAAVVKLVEELPEFLSNLRPETILANLNFVLKEHYSKPDHLKKIPNYYGTHDIRECGHWTQVLELNGIASEPDYQTKVTLTLRRGALMCEQSGLVWLFPSYDVFELET